MALNSEKSMKKCEVCGRWFHHTKTIRGDMLHREVHEAIARIAPDWDMESSVCLQDLNRFRREVVDGLAKNEKEKVQAALAEIEKITKEGDIVTRNINLAFDSRVNFGERIADQVASFGGSWTFIIIFGCIIFIWILLNIIALTMQMHFDPYPFILLNLVLSCLAALQAPVIMMSQNRQSAKDRMQADQDFRTNLAAEAEIRTLHAKMDMVMSKLNCLNDSEQLEMDMISELSSSSGAENETAE